MTKEYLGDGVYVELDEQGLVLTTENGVSTIYLESEVLIALLQYLARRGRTSLGRRNDE